MVPAPETGSTIMSEQEITFTPAAEPHAWVTPQVARWYLASVEPMPETAANGLRASLTSGQTLLSRALDATAKDPDAWPARVDFMHQQRFLVILAAAAILDGQPVSDEDTAAVAKLHRRGLLGSAVTQRQRDALSAALRERGAL